MTSNKKADYFVCICTIRYTADLYRTYYV